MTKSLFTPSIFMLLALFAFPVAAAAPPPGVVAFLKDSVAQCPGGMKPQGGAPADMLWCKNEGGALPPPPGANFKPPPPPEASLAKAPPAPTKAPAAPVARKDAAPNSDTLPPAKVSTPDSAPHDSVPEEKP